MAPPLTPARTSNRPSLAAVCLKCHLNVVLGDRSERPMRRIGFVALPGFQVMSMAVMSVFEFANREMAAPAYEVHVLSETGGAGRRLPRVSLGAGPRGGVDFV